MWAVMVVLLILFMYMCKLSYNEPFVNSPFDNALPIHGAPPLKYTERYVARYWLQILHDHSGQPIYESNHHPLSAKRWVSVNPVIQTKVDQLNKILGYPIIKAVKMSDMKKYWLVEIVKNPGFELRNYYHRALVPEPARRYWLLIDKSGRQYQVYEPTLVQAQPNKTLTSVNMRSRAIKPGSRFFLLDNNTKQKFLLGGEHISQEGQHRTAQQGQLRKCIKTPKHLEADFPLECMINGGFWSIQ